MKGLIILFIMMISLCIPVIADEEQEWTPFRADSRIEINFPSHWNWQEIQTGYKGMKAYMMTDKKSPGLYSLVMVADNPIYQIPDKDVLNELLFSLMNDYPDYVQQGETKFGSDDKRPYFSLSQWENDTTGERLTLIVAGSKKSIVYLWMVYPSEIMEKVYQSLMNDMATSLKIF